MSGLQYDWRKRGADMAKLHPTGTPADVGAAIENASSTAYDVPTPAPLFDAASAAAMQASMLSRIAKSLDPVPFDVSVASARLAVNAPNVRLQTIHNATAYATNILLGSGDGAGKGRLFMVPAGTPLTSLAMFFPQRLYVKSIYTTAGPVSAGTATVGGTPANLQVYTFTLADDQGNPYTVTYTAGAGDTNSTIATNLAANAGAIANLAAILTFTAVGSVVTATAKNAGSLANAYTFSSLSASGSGTLSSSPFSGAALPEVILAGTYA